jgi:uncharacterized protein involved in cysteine biosynthesis
MSALLRAAGLAIRDLFKPGILWHALWPVLVSVALWTVIAYVAWTPARMHLLAMIPDWPWLTTRFSDWQVVSSWLLTVALVLAMVPLVYLTTLILLAAFALPRMIAIVGADDYADLEKLGGGTLRVLGSSIIHTTKAILIFLLGWLLTLPFLLIPGVLLVMSIFWLAWLNQRTFRFDALAEHATPAERDAIVRKDHRTLYVAGGLSALMTYIPVINLLAPAWTALVFVHLCLGRLRVQRQEARENDVGLGG